MRRPSCSDWKIPLWFTAVSMLVCATAPQTGYAKDPGNSQVDKDVDDIIADDGYRWLREESAPVPDMSPAREFGGHGSSVKGKLPQADGDDGCGFEPNFKEWSAPEPKDPDDGCGNSESPDCGCRPDFGNCACDPLPVNCGACVPSPGLLVPMGYVLGGLALALLIFFVVRQIIRRMPGEDILLDGEEMDFDEEEIRVSRIYRTDPASLLDRATEAANTGDYRKAVGYLYLLSLSILSRAGVIELEKSTTNRHILRQIQKNSGPGDAMAVVIRHFEDLFFGNRPPTFERYEQVHRQLVSDLLPLEREATRENS